MMAAVTSSMRDRTGRTLEEWVEAVRTSGVDPLDQNEVRKWLKAEHGVPQNTQWAIAFEAATCWMGGADRRAVHRPAVQRPEGGAATHLRYSPTSDRRTRNRCSSRRPRNLHALCPRSPIRCHRSGHQSPSRPRTTFRRGPRFRTSGAGQSTRAVESQDRAHQHRGRERRSRIADSDRVSAERPVGHSLTATQPLTGRLHESPCSPCRRTGTFFTAGEGRCDVSAQAEERADDGPSSLEERVDGRDTDFRADGKKGTQHTILRR